MRELLIRHTIGSASDSFRRLFPIGAAGAAGLA